MDLLTQLTELIEERRTTKPRYLPGQAIYRAECAPAAGADVLIDNTDPDAPQILRWPSDSR